MTTTQYNNYCNNALFSVVCHPANHMYVAAVKRGKTDVCIRLGKLVKEGSNYEHKGDSILPV